MLRGWLYKIYMTYRFRKVMRRFNRELWKINLERIHKAVEEEKQRRGE